jgi:predicted HicB family RNase H-like nuclease
MRKNCVEMKVRFQPATRTRLEAEAERRSVSMNLLIEHAVEHALDVWEKQEPLLATP